VGRRRFVSCPECGVDAGQSLCSSKYKCDNPACSVYSFRVDYFGKYYDIKYCVDVKPKQERLGGGNDLSSAMNEERSVQQGGKEKYLRVLPLLPKKQ